jgi:FGGY-family pentulose kinase
MIDAHAGGIGGIAMTVNYFEKQLGIMSTLSYEDILVIVSGTSSCFMASSKKANFIAGIWGPYYSAMVPGLFLLEAGQSSCGKLLEHIVITHPAYSKIKSTTENVYETLHEVLIKLAESEGLDEKNLSMLAKDIHVYPDFHGNRSPLADSTMKGSICGLSLDASLNNLALLYLASVQALVYQTRQTITIMQEKSMEFKILTVIGGLSNNRLYCQLLADVCNLPVLVARNGESVVLLGSGILGASNFDEFRKLTFSELVKKFRGFEELDTLVLSPAEREAGCAIGDFHEKKYRVFLRMLEDQREYMRMMNEN